MWVVQMQKPSPSQSWTSLSSSFHLYLHVQVLESGASTEAPIFIHNHYHDDDRQQVLRGGIKETVFFTFSQKKLRPPPSPFLDQLIFFGLGKTPQ